MSNITGLSALRAVLHNAASLADALEAGKVLEREAEMLKDTARDKLGSYQSSAGPFPAWSPLAPSTQADRVRQGYPADEPLLRTGALRDAIDTIDTGEFLTAYVGVDPGDSDMQTIGLTQELGSVNKGIPPRPFLGSTLYEKEKEIIEHVRDAVIGHVSGRLTP